MGTKYGKDFIVVVVDGFVKMAHFILFKMVVNVQIAIDIFFLGVVQCN